MWRYPATLLLTLTLGVLTAAGDGSLPVHRVLQEWLDFSRDELNGLDQGHPVARSLKPGDRLELAVAGAIRVDVPVDFFLTRFTDIVSFKRSSVVQQIGKFSDPPEANDLTDLTFDSAELDAMKRCRIGDCGLHLSAEQIRRANTEVDWSKPDARGHASALLRDMLFEYVHTYWANGNGALLAYRSTKEPLHAFDQLRLLVKHSDSLLKDTPLFRDYLVGTSAERLDNANEFIYWSKEQFGLKPVISITHVIVQKPSAPATAAFVIASKQIYASRYFGGSLALTLGVPGTTTTGPSFYMVYNNRTHSTSFPPVVGGLVRRLAQAQARTGMEDNLRLTKTRLEQDYRR
jgi:hypothetical protein